MSHFTQVGLFPMRCYESRFTKKLCEFCCFLQIELNFHFAASFCQGGGNFTGGGGSVLSFSPFRHPFPTSPGFLSFCEVEVLGTGVG